MQWSTASPNPFPRDATSGLVDGSFTLRKQERVILNASARLGGLAKTAAIPPQAYFSQRMYHVITYILSLKAKNRNVQTTCVKKLLWISFPIGSANIESDPHRVWGQKFHIDVDPQGWRHTRFVEPKLKAFGMKTLAQESCPKHDAQPVPRMPRSYSPSEPSAEPGLHNSSFVGPCVESHKFASFQASPRRQLYQADQNSGVSELSGAGASSGDGPSSCLSR